MTLHEITEKAMSDCFKKNEAFFAFSEEQFAEGSKFNVTYVHLFSGLYCPKDNEATLLEEMEKIFDDGIAEHLCLETPEQIVKDTLANYECYYTNDWAEAVDALKHYPGIDEPFIKKVFYKTQKQMTNLWLIATDTVCVIQSQTEPIAINSKDEMRPYKELFEFVPVHNALCSDIPAHKVTCKKNTSTNKRGKKR